MAFDIDRVRQDFPILSRRLGDEPLIYLDNAATTQKPQAVIDALVSFYSHHNANVHRGSHQLSVGATRLFEEARIKVLRFLQAGPTRQLIWTHGATESINLVAQGWLASRLRPGDEVLISALEHHANLVPWQQLCLAVGAELKVIGLTPGGELDLDQFEQLLSRRTRLLAVTEISNALGVVTPLRSMVERAKSLGVPVLVDGAQAVGHLPPNLQALDADFYVFSGHKMFGPTGIGGLCLKTEHAEAMSPRLFGGEMVDKVSFARSQFTSPPLRFEAGTPHMAGAIGLAAAIDYLESAHLEGRDRHEQGVYRCLENALGQIKGVQILAADTVKQGALSFIVPGEHNFDLGLWLDQYGIAVRSGHHCAMPLMDALQLPGTVRASIAFYNTQEEVETLATVLERRLHTDGGVVAVSAVRSTFWQRMNAEEVCDAFANAGPWQQRYRLLMQLGKELSNDEEPNSSDGLLISGCESTVRLLSQQQGERYWFSFVSESRVIRGLAVVLMAAVNGQSAAQTMAFDFEGYIERLGLAQHLSPSRGNGLRAMIKALRQAVLTVDREK